MTIFRLIAAIAIAIAVSAATAAHADNDGSVHYTVRKGDTLIGLAEKYMLKQQHYAIVQKQNRIANPYRLPVGKVIAIPRHLLKFNPAQARLASVRGEVQVSSGGRPTQASTGQVIGEGAEIITAALSFVTLALSDGSMVSVPSNSGLRVRRLRQYALQDIIDYDFDVVRGGARSKVIPLKSKDDRYRVRSPKAVSAVRGTEFEIRYDESDGNNFAEVDEGGLAVSTANREIALPAGNGLAVSASGMLSVEELLPEPVLENPGKLQSDEDVRFSVPGEYQQLPHRFQIAADAGFVDNVADVTATSGRVVLVELPNGNYFIRVRQIAESGIQGIPATYAFKRRLNGVKASAQQGADGYAFKWIGTGEGVRRYHFQLYRGSTDGIPVIDEIAMDVPEISISDLPAGDYFWRVGSVQFLDGEAETNWTPFEKLTAGAS